MKLFDLKKIKGLSFGILFLSFVFLTHGQTEKGKILLGGGSKLNFTSLNSKSKSDAGSGTDVKTINIDFSPQIGLFIIDNLALGAQMPVAFSSENKAKNSTTSVALAPFLRYYFGKSKIKPYLHGDVGLGYQKLKIGISGLYPDSQPDPGLNPISYSKYGMFLYDLGGGLSIFINEKIFVDIGLGYSSISSKSLKDNANNYRKINSGIGLGLGFSIIL